MKIGLYQIQIQETPKEIRCYNCNNVYTPYKRQEQKFCSSSCFQEDRKNKRVKK